MSETTEQDPLRQKATIVERPFHSTMPLVGRLIVWLRTAWNNVAARWYVQGLFQQQTAFNQLVAAVLSDTEDRLIEQDIDQSALVRQVAELTVEVKQLRRRVAQLEAQLETATADPPSDTRS